MANYSASQSAISRGQDNAALNHGFAGQAILNLLHKAADTAEANSRQALETAQKLSSQLEAAKDRIARLESEVGPVALFYPSVVILLTSLLWLIFFR